ncbi:MAG TPA: hypothetical protein VIJ92_14675 [Ginsengibacter sp.]
MENTEENSNEKNLPESIFTDDELSLEGYDKNIRQARNILFFLAALQMLLGIYLLFTSQGNSGWVSFAITTVVAVIFLLLGFWTKVKPYTAIISGLIIYILLWIGDAIYDPTYIYKGILIKVFIIIYLIKGLKDAKEAQAMKSMLGK